MLSLLAQLFLTGNYSEDCLIGWTSVWKEILLTRQNENSNSQKGSIPFFGNINTQLQLKMDRERTRTKMGLRTRTNKKRRPNSWGLQLSSAPQVFWLDHSDLEKNRGREGDRCADRPVLHLTSPLSSEICDPVYTVLQLQGKPSGNNARTQEPMAKFCLSRKVSLRACLRFYLQTNFWYQLISV